MAVTRGAAAQANNGDVGPDSTNGPNTAGEHEEGDANTAALAAAYSTVSPALVAVLTDLIKKNGPPAMTNVSAPASDPSVMERAVQLLVDNQAQMTKSSGKFTSQLAEALARGTTLQEITEVFDSSPGWKIMATITACEVFKSEGNYIACLQALSKKMPTLDGDIKQAENEMTTLGKDQWDMIKRSVITNQADGDSTTALAELVKTLTSELDGITVKAGRVDNHLAKAQKMLRMAHDAHALFGATIGGPSLADITASFMTGLFKLTNDEHFENSVKVMLKLNKRNPMTLKEGHERVQAFLAVRKDKENHNPQKAGNIAKRGLPWATSNPFTKRPNHGPRLTFPQNSMMLQQPDLLSQLSSWKGALDTASPTEEQADTAAQLTQHGTVSSLLGSLQSALINQHASHQNARDGAAPSASRNHAMSFLQTLTQQAPPQQAPANTTQLLPGQCRDFFLRGNCTYGQACKFSHSLTSAPPASTGRGPCFDFLRNACRRGATCKFAHASPTGAVGGMACKKCYSPDHLYGHKCPKYSGCYRCGNPDHMATGCALPCVSCSSGPGVRCDPNNCEAAARVFRRGPPSRGGH